MRKNVGLVIALAFIGATAPARAADDPYRVKLLLGGGYETGSIGFAQRISQSQFVETATIDTSYSAKSGPGFDGAVQFNVFKHVGLAVAGTRYSRDLTGDYRGSFPHPLYFNRPRAASGSVTGKLTETAGHASLVVFTHSGSLDLSAWGGVSYFKAEAELLQNVDYSQQYPFDAVTVTGTPTAKVSDTPFGFNLGASADWRFSKNVGVGVQGRFARAKAKFAVKDAPDSQVDVGGFQVGGGVRFYF
jgi:opacity protein-like surface antigen